MNTTTSNTHKLTGIAAAIILSLATNTSLAQDATVSEAKGVAAVAGESTDTATDSGANDNVVIVTASRREQSLQDVAAAVSVVDPAEFVDLGLSDLGDVIDYTPGFTMNRGEGHSGTGSITARGVGQLGGTPVVSIYLDDMPLTTGNGFTAGAFVFFDGLLGDIERVELIKGPQGTLFGSTSVGGAIRYISKEPALDKIRGGAKVNFSSVDNGGQDKIYSGFVSVPLIKDTLGITLAAFSEDGGGLVDRVDLATGEVSLKDADTSDSTGFSADILYAATDNLSFRVKGLTQELDFTGTSAVRVDEDLTPTFGHFVSDDQFSNQHIEQTYASVSMNYEMDWATLTATSSYVNYEFSGVEDVTAAFAGFIDLLSGNPPGTTTDVPFEGVTASKKNVQEIRLTSKKSDNIEWIVGLYNSKETGKGIQEAISQPGDFLAFFANFPSVSEETAIFGNFTYYINDDFDFTVGMRSAETKQDLSLIQDGLFSFGAPDVVFPKASADIQTYLFSARYRPSENLSYYASVATGYRPAASNLTVSDPVTGDVLSQPFVRQDDIVSYEVGAKGNFSDGLVRYDMAVWYLEWDDFQTSVFLSGLSAFANAENGITAQGFEGSFTIDPDNDFSITTNFAYSDSTLNSDEVDIGGSAGDVVPGIPKWTFSTRANYGFDVTSSIDGNIGLGLRYTDAWSSAFSLGPRVETDSYTLVDLNASLYMDDITVNFYVNNLLNKKAFASVTAGVFPGTTILDATAVPVRPRTIGISLGYDF